MRTEVRNLRNEISRELARLRKRGWTQQDFAEALKQLLLDEPQVPKFLLKENEHA